ncbi:MAG TPA: transposase family protein [Pyrinomonadaceae bacterium]|nr:transposase family protein [Pyrinomonadaceae bacterium]
MEESSALLVQPFEKVVNCQMQVSTLSADPEAIRILSFVSNSDSITMTVQSAQSFGIRPNCKRTSNHLHGNYIRQITDLPWQGVALRICLQSRKFRCRNQVCERKVFCERLLKVVRSYGRKTVRLPIIQRFSLCPGRRGRFPNGF